MDTMETEGSPLAPTRSLLATPLCRSAQSTEIRAAADGGRDMVGHFAVFNTPTEIRSSFEGHFIERIAPGAFKKTFAEQRDRIRVLFQHGRDPQVGSKPLGPIRTLREDAEGAFYEVPLLDAAYVREIEAGLREGLYGASFQFVATREEWVDEPGPSEENPQGIPERTVLELRLIEFGPVTFGAYPEATSGLRSLTDDYLVQALGGPDEIRALADKLEARATEAAPGAELAEGAQRVADIVAGAERAAAESAPELPADQAEEKTKPTTPAPSQRAAAPGHRTASERRDDKADAPRRPIYGMQKETPPWRI